MIDVEQALASEDPEVRRRAVLDLTSVPDVEQPRLLLAALGDADWRVRKEAVGIAAGLAASRAVLEALVKVLEPGDNVGLRNAAVEALGGFGSRTVEALRSALPTLDADGRKLASEALSRSGDAAAIGVLETLLTDADSNVRAAAIESIAAIGTADIARAALLLERCLVADDTLLVLAAIEGLNRLGARVAWPLLRRHLGNPTLRDAVLTAAGTSGNPDAASYLARALATSEGRAFHVVLRALASLVVSDPACQRAASAALRVLEETPRRHLLEQARASTDDAELRRRALLIVGALGSADAADAVIEALSDDRVAAEAEQALEMLGPAATLALARHARSGPPHERAACVEQLGRLADDASRSIASQAILDATHDGAPEVVRAALGALSHIGDERTIGLAARWLVADSSPAIRQAAVAALAACSTRHAEEAVSFARSANADTADAAVASVIIGALPGPVFATTADDVAFLADAASNQSPVARRAALDALSRFSTPAALEAVSFAIADETPEVQLAAIRTLGRMKDEQGRAIGVTRLLDVVRTFADDAASVAAIDALGDTTDASALEVLRSVVREGTPVRAVAAVHALGRIDAPGRVDALINALSHAEPEVVKAALRALANEERDARTVAHVATCLDHDAWDVRRLAAELLGRRSDAKELLRQRLIHEKEALVREEIQRSLADTEGAAARRTMPPLGGGVA
jgi:HEAT repeat protein